MNYYTRLMQMALSGQKYLAGLPAAQFAGQHTNPTRNAERKALKMVGRRQYLKIRKSMKRSIKEMKCATS